MRNLSCRAMRSLPQSVRIGTADAHAGSNVTCHSVMSPSGCNNLICSCRGKEEVTVAQVQFLHDPKWLYPGVGFNTRRRHGVIIRIIRRQPQAARELQLAKASSCLFTARIP